jgi:hypothetical protein
MSYASITSKSASVAAPVTVTHAPVTHAPVTHAPVTQPMPAPVTKTEKDAMGLLPTEPSICIARAPPSFSDGVIISICQDELHLGKVEKVDIIQKVDANGNDFVTAFIHFKEWSCDEEGGSMRHEIMNGEKIKIVYEDPRYITLCKSYAKRDRDQGSKRQQGGKREQGGKQDRRHFNKREKPRVVIDEDGWSTTTTQRKTKAERMESHTTRKNPEMKRNAVNGFANLAQNSDDE